MDAETYIQNLNNGTIYKNDMIIANKYVIDEFTPSSILDRDGILSVVAMTGCGKTVFIKDLLSHVHKAFKKIIMMSKRVT